MKKQIILGIESSCDETACAVLRGENELLSNIIASSLARHKPFGGVVPEIASRHTLENIDTVYKEALDEAGIKPEDIDMIAVTYGPGLIGSLFVGVSFAKALSYKLQVPLIGVNHLHAHIYANFIEHELPDEPFMGLVVSGGHTSVVYCDDLSFDELATTRDDACGEAFDKVAKMIGLGYPGGPVIDRLAKEGEAVIPFKCGQFKDSCDFSFSGIKTGVLYYVQKCEDVESEVNNICASFQMSVIKDIVTKTLKLCKERKVNVLAVGGGVSANSLLRKMLTEKAEDAGLKVCFPGLTCSLDNGAMIARFGVELSKRDQFADIRLSAVPSLSI